MDVDNLHLSLLGINIFSWYNLRIPVGIPLKPIPRGLLYNNLNIKFPIYFPRVNNNEPDLSLNDLVINDNNNSSGYTGSDDDDDDDE